MYRRKFVRTKSMASVRNKWQTLMFDPTKQKVHEFFNDIQLIAKDALGADFTKVVDQFIYANERPVKKRTKNNIQYQSRTPSCRILIIARESITKQNFAVGNPLWRMNPLRKGNGWNTIKIIKTPNKRQYNPNRRTAKSLSIRKATMPI